MRMKKRHCRDFLWWIRGDEINKLRWDEHERM